MCLVYGKWTVENLPSQKFTKYLIFMAAVCWLITSPAVAEDDGEGRNSFFNIKQNPMFREMVQSVPGMAEKKAAQNNDKGKRRDPFSATRKMMAPEKKPEKKKEVPVSDLIFKPDNKQVKIPQMTLKGQLRGADDEVMALLEIKGGGVYVVREGDTVGLHEVGIDAVIRIKEIGKRHVVVESGSLEQVIIVR